MDINGDIRKWDELIPDALALIFRNLSLREVLTVVPTVCKSWQRVVMGPYCWQEIDIEEWSKNSEPEIVEQMLRLLITRSSGSLKKLCVSGLTGDRSISFVANHAQSLRTLRLPRSEINDPIMESVAGMLSTVTFLDLSYSYNIGARGLKAIGNHLKSLTTLRRVMHPLEVLEKHSQDDEAVAIASTMPRLKHLEIAYFLVETSSIIQILENCKQLELLDVRGCWDVNLDEKYVKNMFPKLKIVGPVVMDCYDTNGWDNCSDYSGSSGYLAWDFVAGETEDDEEYDETWDDLSEDDESIEDVEMWFYDDVNVLHQGYDWPQSP